MAAQPGPDNPFPLSRGPPAPTVSGMVAGEQISIYLDDGELERARAGAFNFLNRLATAVQARGLMPVLRPDNPFNRAMAPSRPEYALFHMKKPAYPNALIFRRAYVYPFWNIEATAARWQFRAAQARFDPHRIDPSRARGFVDRHRVRLYSGMAAPGDDGFVYIPLQGRLRSQRSFQSCSPMKMVERTAEHFASIPVIATLHPKEHYSPAELETLEALAVRHKNLTLRTGDQAELLPRCRLVVTQNSAVAFAGFFFGKPAVLFGKSDFHHIAANVADLGVEGAFEVVQAMRPDFDRYLFWFLQRRAINAGAAGCEDKIVAAMRAGGWDI